MKPLLYSKNEWMIMMIIIPPKGVQAPFILYVEICFDRLKPNTYLVGLKNI
ncbi:MAG: hypothetical protein H0V30_08275 [Chitinophagaceae bacterium]|nr:hypothetical protein [Chitinophagaceae bacterium]